MQPTAQVWPQPRRNRGAGSGGDGLVDGAGHQHSSGGSRSPVSVVRRPSPGRSTTVPTGACPSCERAVIGGCGVAQPWGQPNGGGGASHGGARRRSLHCVSRVERLREFADRLHPSSWLYSTYEHRLISELDHDQLPQHIAVLADGNRRWARVNAPGQPLAVGYRAGADKLKEFVAWCEEVKIPIVTLWVLSTENFARD
ncbi:MAG: undecaprenyl diphosphate synthase family protein, partial [Microlunatus sp.]|nr:undecaprenyl diphosphate synthase family protein [Microlunatus sp.]